MDQAAAALPLSHSWPLFERDRHFDLGHIIGLDPSPGGHTMAWLADNPDFARLGIGWWGCDLIDNALSWTSAVFDIFGLPRGPVPGRGAAAALYTDDSRVKMERLRAHAIRHRRGFTLDAAIRQPSGGLSHMRLIAAPVCDGDRVVRLQGLKLAL